MNKKPHKIILSHSLELCLAIALGTTIMFVFTQVVLRYLFRYTIDWGSDLSRLLLIWCSLVAAVVALKEERHYKVTFFIDKLSPIGKNLVVLVNNLLIGLAIVVLIWYGIEATKIGAMQDYPSLPFTRLWQYIALPVCGALMFYYLIRRLYIIVREIKDCLAMRNKKGK